MNALNYIDYTGEQLMDRLQDFIYDAAKHGVKVLLDENFSRLLAEIDVRLYDAELLQS
jgi:predicted peroxiredoxin